ncbi:MAG: hypothetical protein KY476_25935 [Planctomycetes bacterium]|nr:hypothetical protein [Planctomycetota bacterium]
MATSELTRSQSSVPREGANRADSNAPPLTKGGPGGVRRANLPVLKETRYDLVSSLMMSLVLGLGVTCLCLLVWWVSNRPPVEQDVTPVEMIELPGGVEDGAIDETLKLESPEEEIPDPSVAEESEEVQVEEVLENVLEFSDRATNQLQPTFDTDVQSSGKAGSASGTGRAALGMGGGEKGLPRAERWFINWSDRATLDEYAQQLDFFGIRFAILRPGEPALIISNFSAEKPQVTTVAKGDKDQLYFSWRGGSRRQADAQLCQKAGVNVGNQPILHLYPAATEQALARLEKDYRNRPPEQVRRTYFSVQRAGRGYQFVVTRQITF